MPPLTRHPRSSVRPALAALILAACPTLVAACIETPAPYSEAEFQDIVTRSPDTSVPPLTCPADDPQCECTVLAHCAAIACQSNTACEDRRCVRRAKPDCETCAVPRDCPDDGDLCRPAACNLVAGGIGECARTDLACDDHRTCTANRCDPAQGCVYDDSCDPPRLTLPLTATTLEGDWSLSGTFAGTTADGETFRAEVDWGEGQGTQPLDLDGTTLRLVHAWKEPGTFDVKVRVIDSFERSGEATVAVTVDNAAPIVTVHQAPSSIDEGASFGFEGTVLDPGGNVGLVGKIDFGDGSAPAPLVINASGDFTAPTHRFGKDSNSGAFDVIVTIADLQGRTGQASHRLTVRNVAPRVGKPLSPPTLLEGTTTTLKLALIEPGDDPLTGTINIGTETASFEVEDRDGTKSLLITLRYPNDGPQTVSYNLRDDDGAAVADSFVVNVANVAPAIVALDPASLPLAGQEGAPLAVSLAFTDPGADQAEWRASVDWGDGTPASPVPVDTTQKRVTLTHTYRDNGDYTVRLTVSDAVGSDVAALPVAIANTAPKPNLGGNETLAEGATWTRSGSVTDAGQDTFSGSLAIADGPAQSIAIAADGAYALSHRFTQDGTYPIAFTVTDDDGTAATAHATLTVTNVVPSIDCGGTVASIPEGQRLTRPCSVTDPGADLLTAQVDYGEGTGATPIAIADGQITLDHRWADAAPSSDEGAFYRVTIRVADDHTATELVVRVAVGNVPPAVDVGPDQEILEGASLAATGHVATAVEDDPVDAVVAWGDGQSGPLPVAADGTFTLAHRYVQDGVYTARVTVVDGDGDVGTDTLTVTVRNVVPVVSMGPAANLLEGGTLTRTIQVVDPGTLDTLVATIDSGRGTALTTAPVAPDGTLALALPYPQDGTYTVRVEVSDGGEVDGVGTLVVSVANVAPTVADIAAQEVDEGALAAAEIVVTDPGAETFALTIAWGDGQTDALDGTVARYPIAHRYADDGTYEVTAEVSDGVATTATRFAIRVANVAPIFVPGPLTTSHEGSPWTLTGAVADVGLADTFTGEVRWSAGTAFTPFDAARGDNRVAHTYPQEGSYPVTVRVQDDDGALVEVAVVAQVDNVAPTFTLGADATVDEGATFTRSVTFADPGADTWLADLDYGDGATAHLPVAAGAPFPASHAYRDEGTYVLSLAVYDGTATTHDTMAVTVRNVAPTVNVGGPVTIGEGGTLLRQGSVTDPGLDDALTATVDWGEGLGPTALPLTGRDLALAHTYPRNGVYLVTVTATDDSGATGQASFQVTVSNSAPAVQAGANATLTEGDTFERVIAFTDPGSNAWTATVDWGDGTPLEAAPVDGATKAVSLVHRFRRDGVFTVTVSVFDGVETGSGSFIATVQNAAPVVSLGAAATLAEGALFARQGTVADLGPDDVHTGTVSYGDGTASEPLVIANRAFALSHAYADNG
ncbi:MAG: PKD domain-containing protein, partial [Deltaproteobacteria bacterium]|nr:PKD domain-containing protein [Deltaproteobacteria bacterium]